MHRHGKQVGSLLTALAVLGWIGVAGCAVRGSARYYDPDYDDYHQWNHAEIVYYHRWEAETHRQDEDFSRRNRQDQDDYWRWRHQHRDHDQDHDHDRR